MINAYDPTQPGNEYWVNSPYQYWSGTTNQAKGGQVEFAINSRVFRVPISAEGSWEFQLPLMLAEGGHNLSYRYIDRAGNTGDPYQARINVDLSAPDKPGISTIYDDVGSEQGPLPNNGYTDDNKPKVTGYAEPGSVVRLYSNGELMGSVIAEKNGRWTLEPQLKNGKNNIHVTATDQFDQVSVASNTFTININTPLPEIKPEITSAYDDFGVQQGPLKNGDVTDDQTPLLKGSAKASSQVWLFERHEDGEWRALGSAKANSAGEWQFNASFDTRKLAGTHQFQVSGSVQRDTSAATFELTYVTTPPPVGDKGIIWDFEDGTAQGWISAGKYLSQNEAIVKKWTGSGQSFSLGSMTDDETTSGYQGEVIYRYIKVEAGKSYDFSFDAVNHTNLGKAPKIGLSVDGQSIISPENLGAYWSHLSGTYQATENKLVRVAIINDTATGTGNDFAIDNIAVKPIELEKELIWKFEDGTLQGWNAVGKYAKRGELIAKKWTGDNESYSLGSITNDKTTYGYNGDVIYRYMMVEAGKSYEFSFDGMRLLNNFSEPKLGISVDGVSVIAQTAMDSHWNHYTGIYQATETKQIRVALTNATATGTGNDFAVDNIAMKPLTSTSSVHNVKASSLGLEDLLLNTHELAQVNMASSQKSDLLKLNVSDILSAGSKDLFVQDGKTQLMVNGDKHDRVQLDDLLANGVDTGNWSQQKGAITVSGVKYNVYSHTGVDVEVLVQQGIQTDLI